MRIVYFYQYFTTPNGSWGTRVYDYTKQWVEQGHEVEVVTSVYSKSDLIATRFLENQIIDGIKLKIINVKIDNKQGFLRRIFTFMVYIFFSTYYALTLKCDLVISSSGPITVGVPGLIANIIRRKKLVFEVRDLWPQAPIELGILNNIWLQKLSYAFEKWCYKRSSLVVALSPGIRQNILDRFPDTKVVSVTNSANIAMFSVPKTPIEHPLLRGKKYAVYTGNIGMVNNSELLYNAAIRLRELDRDDINIVMIGDGQLKVDLEDKSRNIDNIYFLDLMPKKDLVNFVQNAFVSLIPLNNTPILATSSPNKLFESMAASVPVIQTTFGWIEELLATTGTGFTVSADDKNELVEKLIYLADNENVATQMGERAFEYAKTNFDKEVLAKRMINAIEKVYKA